MYRAIPEGNKLLSRRWREKERVIHMGKLQNMRSAVDMKEPANFIHLRKKLKKNQMQEGNSLLRDDNFFRTLYRD